MSFVNDSRYLKRVKHITCICKIASGHDYWQNYWEHYLFKIFPSRTPLKIKNNKNISQLKYFIYNEFLVLSFINTMYQIEFFFGVIALCLECGFKRIVHFHRELTSFLVKESHKNIIYTLFLVKIKLKFKGCINNLSI